MAEVLSQTVFTSLKEFEKKCKDLKLNKPESGDPESLLLKVFNDEERYPNYATHRVNAIKFEKVFDDSTESNLTLEELEAIQKDIRNCWIPELDKLVDKLDETDSDELDWVNYRIQNLKLEMVPRVRRFLTLRDAMKVAREDSDLQEIELKELAADMDGISDNKLERINSRIRDLKFRMKSIGKKFLKLVREVRETCSLAIWLDDCLTAEISNRKNGIVEDEDEQEEEEPASKRRKLDKDKAGLCLWVDDLVVNHFAWARSPKPTPTHEQDLAVLYKIIGETDEDSRNGYRQLAPCWNQLEKGQWENFAIYKEAMKAAGAPKMPGDSAVWIWSRQLQARQEMGCFATDRPMPTFSVAEYTKGV